MLWQWRTTAKRGITVEIAKEGYLIRRVPALHIVIGTPRVEGGEPNFRLPHRRVLNIKKVKYMLMLIISHKWVNLYLTVKMDIN